ncbi:hypothetical protein [Sulfurisphaera tokodaii]|uniref:Uncharacterized protein n=2 Tax=Sulfurisphaera tokodaii TaxID=111955 RepID=Q970K6_SULTO|nr:hypothetical protein [Sulfurisphaera tokodaii]BAB66667.1 hypothetical protein STK_15900 [Sulfurisphaera tokodaii str. 7]HII73512.1 hypothetical protein [Sulfurisphaera tokodaii]
MKKEKRAVSNIVFAGVVIVLIIIAAIGFALYATKKPSTVTTTSISSLTVTQTSTTTSTVTQTSTQTVTQTTTQTTTVVRPITVNASGAFYDGQVITFLYTAQFMCTPNATVFFPNAVNQSKVAMGCEVGAGNISAFPKGAAPVFVLVPAFAGLSIFGVQSLGATPQGFPVFKYNGENYTIYTQCGAALTPTACPDHMSLIYSPAFTIVEQYLGIKNGVFGLPEGVLPTPAHDHLVTFTTNTSIPWYIVVVLVFNPNIFPNPITGQCQQIVPSNQTDPTQYCLNSISALEQAMQTYDSAVATANANNPIWLALGKPGLDVVVPGITSPSQLFSATNSNMVLFFSDPDIYPYPI